MNTLLLYLLLLGSKALADTGHPDTQDKGLLWRIEGKGLTSSSYLYGTIHILPKEYFSISEPLKQAMDSTSQLMTEIVLDGAAIMQSAGSMILTPPASYSTLLSAEELTKLNQFMQDSIPQPIPMFQLFKPIFLTQQIVVSYCIPGIPESYELYFTKLFKDQNKPLLGLETVKDQMAFLDSIPVEVQVKELMRTIDQPRENCEQYREMLAYYLEGDLKKLMEMIEADPGLGNYTQTLLDDRNERWISTIEQSISQRPTFIAIGAGHLGGEKGVITLLRKKGYEITPVLQ